MPWKNISDKPLQLPLGAEILPGKQFSDKQGEGLNLRALEHSKVVKHVGRKVKKNG